MQEKKPTPIGEVTVTSLPVDGGRRVLVSWGCLPQSSEQSQTPREDGAAATPAFYHYAVIVLACGKGGHTKGQFPKLTHTLPGRLVTVLSDLILAQANAIFKFLKNNYNSWKG